MHAVTERNTDLRHQVQKSKDGDAWQGAVKGWYLETSNTVSGQCLLYTHLTHVTQQPCKVRL